MTILAALGPKARALVQAGRGALRPTEGDRARIETALRERLGSAVLPPDVAAPPPAGGSVSPPPAGVAVGWQVVAGAVVGVGLIGAVAYLAWPEPRPASPQARDSAARTAPAELKAPAPLAPPIASSTAAPAPTTHSAPIPSARPPSTERPPKEDRLAEEVALLSQATRALRAGRTGEALQVLAEHQRRFPRGALGEERRAARAQALCLQGRVADGRAELSRLAPRSPAAARAKQVCDSVSSTESAKPSERP